MSKYIRYNGRLYKALDGDAEIVYSALKNSSTGGTAVKKIVDKRRGCEVEWANGFTAFYDYDEGADAAEFDRLINRRDTLHMPYSDKMKFYNKFHWERF